MNYYKRLHIAQQTGTDPLKKEPKQKVEKWKLIETRTDTVLIEGPRALCEWKRKNHVSQNPLSKYRFEPVL